MTPPLHLSFTHLAFLTRRPYIILPCLLQLCCGWREALAHQAAQACCVYPCSHRRCSCNCSSRLLLPLQQRLQLAVRRHLLLLVMAQQLHLACLGRLRQHQRCPLCTSVSLPAAVTRPLLLVARPSRCFRSSCVLLVI